MSLPGEQRQSGWTARPSAYKIHDRDGTLIAVHRRKDLPGGKKKMWFELPDGTSSLNGLSTADLPSTDRSS